MNHEPLEHESPLLLCCSTAHGTDNSCVASWFVDFEGEKDNPYCSSCHFLLKRSDEILSDRRIPRRTLVFNLPNNLTNDQLIEEITLHRNQAEDLGYWSADRQFYDILNVNGAVRLTFRMI
jgi:hypothetical protein